MRLIQALLPTVLGIVSLGACQPADTIGGPPGVPLNVALAGPVAPTAVPSTPDSPSPTVSPSPAPPSLTAIAATVVALTNDFRAEQGQPALATAAPLMAFARSRSLDMATRGYFAHTTPDGLSVFDLLKQAGLSGTAARENIGWNKGYPAAEVARVAMDGWIASPGHRTNLLASDVTTLGVGVAQAEDGAWYLTQVFKQ